MCVCVHVLHLLCINPVLNELGEVSFILRWIFLLEHFHVLFDMLTEDARLMGFGVVLWILSLLLCRTEAGEVLGVMWHMKATINSTLESSPHTSAYACAT